MSGNSEFRCFIGGLSWSVSDQGLRDAFEKFGHLLEAKVVIDKVSGRSRSFGFVTFDEQQAMEEAIDAMNGIDLDGQTINVDRARPQQGSCRYYDNCDCDHRDRGREYGSGQGTGSGGCFNYGKSGHFARECPSDGAKGSRYEGRENRYGGGGGARHGPDRNEDRFRRRNRDNGADRYSRDRAGPYDQRGSGGF